MMQPPESEFRYY